MKKTCLLVLAVIATLISSGALRAEITTVILPDDTVSTFPVAAQADSTDTKTLTFTVGPGFTAGAKVTKCALRVVSVPVPARRADQDVTVYKDNEQVGQWSAYYKDPPKPRERPKPERHAAELMPKACAPGTTVFTLKTDSKFTSWEYYGGTATPSWNQPRLIVTYDSPSPARSGLSTDWKYAEPASFFSSRLWEASSGEKLLANPVSYDGAVYLIAEPSSAPRLYRAADGGNWFLSSYVDEGSFAFVTGWGRLQIITKEAVLSCDLTTLATLSNAGKLVCATANTGEKISLEKRETPAIGPDGSVYFKNVEAAGSIVARNPVLKEIWRTDLALTAVSPIALSANGQYAYVLANLAINAPGATKTTRLLRVDTTTGETVTHELSYKDKDNKIVSPDLPALLLPAVASKGGVDYVFIAGNTSDTGVLQLIIFEAGAAPVLKWSRPDKLATAPVLSADGNSLFVAWQDGTIGRYPWYNTTKGQQGAYTESGLKSERLGNVAGASAIVVDANGSVYISANQSLYAYSSAAKKISPASPQLGLAPTLQFTTDGALIGYDSSKVYDFSPKAAPAKSWPSKLTTKTIYSAENINVPSGAGVETGNEVILKGNSIKFPIDFHWPVGATLKVQSVKQ